MSMDFVRSSTLAGKNVERLLTATIRGAIRRNDADGGSLVPYFPAIFGQGLNISTETGAYTVTFTGNGIATVISDIDTALGAHGSAYDADGVVAIQTSVNGGNGWIEVTGGSAAPILGFDLNLGRRLLSVGGDLASAPEGRIGNLMGTVFPGKGDDFKMGVFQRPLAALAANVDVLHSDVAKQDAVLQSLGTLTAVTDGGGCHFYVPTSKIYNGYDSNGNKLSVSSTQLDLSAYFVLLDVNTRRRLPNYVSAVLVGATHTVVAGTAANMTDTGKSALGANIRKANYAITGITDGRVIHAAGAGSTAVVGDLIEITGATNLVPWNNNGIRWICDGIVGTDYISVRPASKAELSTMGQSSPQGQLQTSLNGNPSGSFGSINIYTGPYVSAVSLVVTPSITNGTSVEIWAMQPLANRERRQTGSTIPGLATPLVFGNQYASSSFPHLASRSFSGGDTADLLQLQDQTGAYLLKVTSAGNLTAAGATSIGTVASTLTLAPTGKLLLNSAGTNWWELDTAGVLRGVNTASKLVKGGGSAFDFGTQDGFALNLLTNNVTKWQIDTSGNLWGVPNSAQSISKSLGTLNIRADAGLTLMTSTTDIALRTDTLNPYGWNLDSANNGQLRAMHSSSHKIIGASGLVLDDGVGNLFLSTDGTGLFVLQGTQPFGAGTPASRVLGAITGANGSSIPGISLESTGTNAGIQFKTNGTAKWIIDTLGNISAQTTAAYISNTTASGTLQVLSLSTAIFASSNGAAQISAATEIDLQIGGATKWKMDGVNLVNVSSGTLQMNSQKITGVGAPSANTTDAATTAYIDTTFVGAAHTWGADQNLGTHKITGLAGPTFAATDAANAVYVDKHATLNFGISATPADNNPYYIPFGYSNAAVDFIIRGGVVPYACTLQGMVLSVATGPNAGTETYTVYKKSGGSDTALSVVVTVTGTGAAVSSDFAHAASLAAGDMLFLKRTASGVSGAGSTFVVASLVCSA